MAKHIVKLKNCQFNRFKNHKNTLKRLNHQHLMQFKRLYQQPNHIDRVIGNWQLVEIHQIPNPFNVGNEVDFWCCDDNKLVLLRICHQSYQQFTKIHPDIKKQTPAYWIAELPIAPSQIIDDEFLLKLLQVFDKGLDKKLAFKSGFGMLKTNIPAVPVDFDVSVFVKPEDYGIIIPEGSVITINIPTKLN